MGLTFKHSDRQNWVLSPCHGSWVAILASSQHPEGAQDTQTVSPNGHPFWMHVLLPDTALSAGLFDGFGAHVLLVRSHKGCKTMLILRSSKNPMLG